MLTVRARRGTSVAHQMKVAIRKARTKAQKLGVKCDLHAMDFLDTEAVSKLSMTFDVILDVGCFHSMPAQDRLTYKESFKLVSQPRSTYLLWCFLRGSRWTPGPPGVARDEPEKIFVNLYHVVEKRILNTHFREMLFYIMQRDSEAKKPNKM